MQTSSDPALTDEESADPTSPPRPLAPPLPTLDWKESLMSTRRVYARPMCRYDTWDEVGDEETFVCWVIMTSECRVILAFHLSLETGLIQVYDTAGTLLFNISCYTQQSGRSEPSTDCDTHMLTYSVAGGVQLDCGNKESKKAGSVEPHRGKVKPTKLDIGRYVCSAHSWRVKFPSKCSSVNRRVTVLAGAMSVCTDSACLGAELLPYYLRDRNDYENPMCCLLELSKVMFRVACRDARGVHYEVVDALTNGLRVVVTVFPESKAESVEERRPTSNIQRVMEMRSWDTDGLVYGLGAYGESELTLYSSHSGLLIGTVGTREPWGEGCRASLRGLILTFRKTDVADSYTISRSNCGLFEERLGAKIRVEGGVAHVEFYDAVEQDGYQFSLMLCWTAMKLHGQWGGDEAPVPHLDSYIYSDILPELSPPVISRALGYCRVSESMISSSLNIWCSEGDSVPPLGAGKPSTSLS